MYQRYDSEQQAWINIPDEIATEGDRKVDEPSAKSGNSFSNTELYGVPGSVGKMLTDAAKRAGVPDYNFDAAAEKAAPGHGWKIEGGRGWQLGANEEQIYRDILRNSDDPRLQALADERSQESYDTGARAGVKRDEELARKNAEGDGFDLASIALPIALGFALGPMGMNLAGTLGMSGWSASAFTGALTSALSGGNPLQGALTAGITNGITGGADPSGMAGMDAEMGAAALAGSGQNYDQFLAKLTEGGSATDVLIATIGGPSSNPQNMLMASNGGTMTDVGSEGYGSIANTTGVSSDATDMTGFKTESVAQPTPWDGSSATPYSTETYSPGTYGASSGGASGGKYNGFGSGLINWAKENEKLAAVGASSAIGLIGGVMANANADERLDKQIASQKELTSQKTQEQIALDNSRREAIQKGSYFDADLKMKPGSKVLRRPDGTLVYASPGIIAGQMKG